MNSPTLGRKPAGDPTSEPQASSRMGSYSGTTAITESDSSKVRQLPPTTTRRTLRSLDGDDAGGTQLDARVASDGHATSSGKFTGRKLNSENEKIDRFPSSRLSRGAGTSATPQGAIWKASIGNSTSKQWGLSWEDGGGRSSWAPSWPRLQGIASSLLGTSESVGVSQQEDEERLRRERIKERRRRAGLEDVSGIRTSAASLHPRSPSSSVRSRSGGTGIDVVGNGAERGRRRVNYSDRSERSPLSITRRRGQLVDFGPPESSSLSPISRTIGKRATSPELSSERTSTSEPDVDTLAYLHHVKLTDTLEGIAIRYNIHPSCLRKANRLWPGDSIQYRKELFLPVDECLVKGKPLPLEEQQTLLADSDLRKRRPPERAEMDDAETSKGSTSSNGKRRPSLGNNFNYNSPCSTPQNIYNNHNEIYYDNASDCVESHNPDSFKASVNHRDPSNTTPLNEDDDPLYKHESYVSIDCIGTVQIVRLSRKKLSHFPPRRKKNISVSSLSTFSPSSYSDNIIMELNPLPNGEISSSSSVFASNIVSNAYGASDEIPNFSQALKKVAAETLEGVESVGGVLEGYIRKFRTKVGDFVGDMAHSRGDLIELTAQGLGMGNEGDGGDRAPNFRNEGNSSRGIGGGSRNESKNGSWKAYETGERSSISSSSLRHGISNLGSPSPTLRTKSKGPRKDGGLKGD